MFGKTIEDKQYYRKTLLGRFHLHCHTRDNDVTTPRVVED